MCVLASWVKPIYESWRHSDELSYTDQWPHPLTMMMKRSLADHRRTDWSCCQWLLLRLRCSPISLMVWQISPTHNAYTTATLMLVTQLLVIVMPSKLKWSLKCTPFFHVCSVGEWKIFLGIAADGSQQPWSLYAFFLPCTHRRCVGTAFIRIFSPMYQLAFVSLMPTWVICDPSLVFNEYT